MVTAPVIKDAYTKRKSLGDAAHRKIMQIFRTYMVVGGMPQAVKSSSYKNHKSFDLFLQKYPIKVEDKYIIYTKDLQYENGIIYIPLYMTICL